jgi:hypothetical protein
VSQPGRIIRSKENHQEQCHSQRGSSGAGVASQPERIIHQEMGEIAKPCIQDENTAIALDKEVLRRGKGEMLAVSMVKMNAALHSHCSSSSALIVQYFTVTPALYSPGNGMKTWRQ